MRTAKHEPSAALGQRESETVADPTLLGTHYPRLYRFALCGTDPVAGSIFNPQSLNRYAYVLNNPANLIDPLGLQEHGEQWPPGAPSWWINAVEDCRRRGDGGCLRTLYTNGWGSGTSLHCQWDGIWDNCSDIFGPMTEPLVLFDPGEANSEGIIRGPGVAILPADPTLPRIGPALDAVTPTIGPAPEPEKPSCTEYYLDELTGGVFGFLTSQATDVAIKKGSGSASKLMYDEGFREGVKRAVPGLGMTGGRFAWLGRAFKWAPTFAAGYSGAEAVYATGKMVKAKFSGGCRSPEWPF